MFMDVWTRVMLEIFWQMLPEFVVLLGLSLMGHVVTWRRSSISISPFLRVVPVHVVPLKLKLVNSINQRNVVVWWFSLVIGFLLMAVEYWFFQLTIFKPS